MNGGKLMNVRYSTTPSGERLTYAGNSIQWQHIDWKTVEKNVNKLQTRIAKAVKLEKWHLVKRLQHLLTTSFQARLLAVKEVTQNKGRRTAEFYGSKGLSVLSLAGHGQPFEAGSVIFSAAGDLQMLFRLWRISQTFLSMTCAIAGKTRELVDAAKAANSDVLIATSRKIHPGFRKYEIRALKAGGGTHHRNSLSDSILVTQNHLEITGEPGRLKAVKKVEIEPRNEEEVFKYAETADLLLLDHYSPEELGKFVPRLREINPGLEIAVGGIKARDVAVYAPNVDVIITTAPYYAMPLDMTAKIRKA
jgi:nicotinate-nucleotide pyrophosphorylase (carboxylating)/molybdenum transport protein